MRKDPSQGGTYVQETAVSRRREYSEEGDNDDEYNRPHQGQLPTDKGQAYRMFATGGSAGRFPTNTLLEQDPLEKDTLVEDPLMEEDTLVVDPQMEEDHLCHRRTRTTRPSRTSRTCETNNHANTSYNCGHHCFGKYF